MTVIYDMSRLTFDINVAETDVVKLKAGQPVRFTADSLDGQEFTGGVEKVNIKPQVRSPSLAPCWQGRAEEEEWACRLPTTDAVAA